MDRGKGEARCPLADSVDPIALNNADATTTLIDGSQAGLMLFNSGYHAVSDTLSLRKPIVVRPSKNHADRRDNRKRSQASSLAS